MTHSEYIVTLLRELERLRPPGSRSAHHAITWTRADEQDKLVLFINVGDCIFPYTASSDEITEDPIETAQRLVPGIKEGLHQEPLMLYTFKT